MKMLLESVTEAVCVYGSCRRVGRSGSFKRPVLRSCKVRDAGRRDLLEDSRETALSPVRPRERLVVLDVLRGVAILGILIPNLEVFRTPDLSVFTEASPMFEQAFQFFSLTFTQGKFITSLAFLLGLGLAMQAARSSQERSPNRFLARRLGVLALFGLVHGFLVWSGDVLLFYAILGFPFLLFIHSSPRTLVRWAIGLLGFFLVLALLFTVFTLLAPVLAPETSQGATVEDSPSGETFSFLFGGDSLEASAEEAYTSGSYLQMTLQRAQEFLLFLPAGLFSSGPGVFAMMLLGAAVAKAGWLEDLGGRRRSIRRAAVLGISLGLPLNLFFALTFLWDPVGKIYLFPLGGGAWLIGAPLLAIGYMASAALLAQRFSAAALVQRLAAVGRMALTNYLLQSIIMTAIFYGLALYGKLGLLPSLAILLAVWAAELLWSKPWLSRSPYGPAEWLWRRLTYGRRADLQAKSREAAGPFQG